MKHRTARFLATPIAILTVYGIATPLAEYYGKDPLTVGSILLLVLWGLWTEHRISALERKHSSKKRGKKDE